MSKQANPTAVGIFVIGAIAIAVVGILVLGAGKLFEKHSRFIVYFQSSANGLKEGSDVLLGGVKVGSVEKMYVQFDPETNGKIIPVIIKLSANRIASLSPEPRDSRDEVLSLKAVKEAIADGLRARLMNQSALTGQLYIDLDFLPADATTYTFPGETIDGLAQIPTVKNQIQQVLEMIAKGIEGLGKRDLGELVDNVNKTVAELNTKIAELDLKGISDKTKSTLDNIDSTFENLNEVVAGEGFKTAISNLEIATAEIKELAEKIDGDNINIAIENAAVAMEKVGTAAGNVATLTDSESVTMIRLNRALASIDGAARSMQELTEFLRRNPNALVTGKKPR